MGIDAESTAIGHKSNTGTGTGVTGAGNDNIFCACSQVECLDTALQDAGKISVTWRRLSIFLLILLAFIVSQFSLLISFPMFHLLAASASLAPTPKVFSCLTS